MKEVDRIRHYNAEIARCRAAMIMLRQKDVQLRVNTQIKNEGFVSALVRQRFDTEGSSRGIGWRRLKPGTILQRRRLGFGAGPILQRSGILKNAAVGGKVTATAAGISIAMQDRAAPVYTGGGKFKRGRGAKAKRLSEYAGALNAVRPFYPPFTKKEMAPLMKRKKELLKKYTLGAISRLQKTI